MCPKRVWRRLSSLAMALVVFAGCSKSPTPVPEPKSVTPFKLVERAPGTRFRIDSPPAAPVFVPRFSLPGSDEGVMLELPTPALPPAPTGTTQQGLAAGCTTLHYLLDRAGTDDTTGIDNRFSWWNKTPPASGPLSSPAADTFGVVRKSLLCHFHPALARVVGRPKSSIGNAGFKLLSWAGAAINSPNNLPDVEFIVRTLRPHSNPVVRSVSAAGSQTPRVLVNESAPGYQFDLSGDRLRPSLWIDFAVPQRAVAIEYGIPANAGTDINHAAAKLIGYDREGRVLRISDDSGVVDLLSDGRSYNGSDNLSPGDFENIIGIQDREGRISTVELRYDYNHADFLDTGGDPGGKLTVPQIVTRIWHEPLPPAATLQGFVGVSTFLPPANPPTNAIVPSTFTALFGKAPGPETISLPFRFNRAAVMIRGIRWQFSHPSPRRITELSAGIGPPGVVELARMEQRDADGVTTLNPRRLTLTPSGKIVAEAGSNYPFHLIVDYSLVGWNSEQVELYGTTGSANSGAAEDAIAVSQVTVGDPCPFSSTSISVTRRRELCGPLFGASQNIVVRLSPDQEIGDIDLVVASETGLSGAYRGLSLRRDDQGSQPVVIWEQGLRFEGSDSNPHRLAFTGVVLSGPSLRVGPDSLVPADEPPPEPVKYTYAAPPVLPNAVTGPRDDRSDYGFVPGIHRSLGIAWPLLADIAFIGLEEFVSAPGGPLQQFDVEVKGEIYQGEIVDWKTGLGINTEPPIIGGLGATRDRAIAAIASFGGIDDVQPFTLGLATKQDLYFENGVKGLTQSGMDQPGLLSNTGRDALWIEEVRKGTQPADSYFDFRFLITRHLMETGGNAGFNFVRLTEQQLRDRLPLMLRPGEQMRIVGHYTPAEPTTFLPHMGSIEFRLKSDVSSSKTVFAFGTAIAASPGGEWRPSKIVFPTVTAIGVPAQEVAMLATTGSTPLAMRRLYFEDETLGYRYEVLPRIESEVLGIRVICGDTTTVCRGQTRLIADTNAGLIPLTVRKERFVPPGGG